MPPMSTAAAMIRVVFMGSSCDLLTRMTSDAGRAVHQTKVSIDTFVQ